MAYYNFDDCSANDSSGNNNNGKINGNLACISGIANKALQFDGASYITVPNAASLNPTTQLTTSFWIWIDAFPNAWTGILHKGGLRPSCSENREYVVWLNNAGFFTQESASIGGCPPTALNSKNVITKGKWIHYASVIDRVKHTMSIYINGALSSTQSDNYSSFNINTSNLRIGFSEEGQSWETPFKGTLDEIRLYNRALTAANITALYNQGVSVNGTIKSMAAHSVTCQNVTTAQSITIAASTVTAYDCEARGLKINPQDHITITIDGNAQ
jgi:hypothetical protein